MDEKLFKAMGRIGGANIAMRVYRCGSDCWCYFYPLRRKIVKRKESFTFLSE